MNSNIYMLLLSGFDILQLVHTLITRWLKKKMNKKIEKKRKNIL